MKKYSVLFGYIIIIIGLFILFYNYFIDKKNTAIENMNLLLLEQTKPVVEEINNEEKDKKTEAIIEEDKINTNEQADETNYIPPTYYYIGRIEIPKINLKKGFLQKEDKDNTIEKNVMVHNLSDYPDVENGNFILVAHSGTAYISYFKNLYKLNIGDFAYVYYNNIKYTYKIDNIYTVIKTGEVSIKRDYSKSTLTLITCTKDDDYHQTVYILYLIEKEEQ